MRNYATKRMVISGMFVLILGLLFESHLAFGSPKAKKKAPRKSRSPWGANWFPNVPLTTHEGKTVRFFDDLLKDKVVVINFIYTTCPDSCPLETARLVQVQQILGDRVGRDVFMYSISIDPERDTPEVLKEYAKNYQVGPGWLFLTGKEDDITRLRKKLGLYIDEIQEDGSYDHNLSLIIGNQATGRWKKSSPFDNPYFLANQIGGWLHNWKLPEANPNNFASAPKLRTPTTGENLFRTRCAACHTIGKGDVTNPEERRVGPDLLGVTDKREREWLARWLADPQKMFEEKDPIIMELYAKYNNVVMPDMDLNDHEVDRLIEYMSEESLRVEKTLSKKEIALPATGDCCEKRKELLAVGARDSVKNDSGPTYSMVVCGLLVAVLSLLTLVGWRLARP